MNKKNTNALSHRFTYFLMTSLLYISPLSPAFAETLHWHDESISYLYGDNFEVSPEKQSTITLEHASGWSWGDLFIFVDATHYHNSNKGDGLYGEFSPRFSFSKITGKDFKPGILKDVLLATTYEFGKGNVETILAGPGFDIDVPGADYFSLNLYRRIPLNDRDGYGIQITPTWSFTMPVAGSNVIFSGYMDWNISDDGSYSKNLHFNPQLKYDLGKKAGLKDKKLLIGIEYSYWKNKYGIKDSDAFDTDQSVVSLLIQSHL